jgi:hypothetical protein
MLCRKSGGGASAGFGSSGDVAVVPVVATATVPPLALAALVAAGGVAPGPSAAIAAEAKAPTRSAANVPVAIFTRPLGPVPVRIGTNLQKKAVNSPYVARHEKGMSAASGMAW